MNAKKQLELLIRTLQAIQANTKIENENALIRFNELCEHYRITEQLLQMESVTHIFEDEATTAFQAETRIKQLYVYRSQLDDLGEFLGQISLLERQNLTLEEQGSATNAAPENVLAGNLNKEQHSDVQEFINMVQNTPEKYNALLLLGSFIKVAFNVAMELSNLYELTNIELPIEEPLTIQQAATPATQPEPPTLTDEKNLRHAKLLQRIKEDTRLLELFISRKPMKGEQPEEAEQPEQPEEAEQNYKFINENDKAKYICGIIEDALQWKDKGGKHCTIIRKALKNCTHSFIKKTDSEICSMFGKYELPLNSKTVNNWRNDW